MTGPRCVVCTRPVLQGRPHGGCAPYLALAPRDYEPPVRYVPVPPPTLAADPPAVDWRDAGILVVLALAAVAVAVVGAYCRR